jgi:site-specific DNA-methyltransferase (adenine-specific)
MISKSNGLSQGLLLIPVKGFGIVVQKGQHMERIRAPRNRTLTCTEAEIAEMSTALMHLTEKIDSGSLANQIINQDLFEALPFLPDRFIDLLIVDPPYNLTKDYNGHLFRSKEGAEYTAWFDGIISSIIPLLEPTASIYVCSDWQTSTLVFPVLDTYFNVRNRITWEREKGRGSKTNWKNNTEDIWYCTVGDEFIFDVDAVKLKRRVLAPYRSDDGQPKDWDETENGNYRLTHPSNLWSDITIPFWSMPENTDHPTQKPEKLLAKLILASSRPYDFIFDPFLGSGTTAVVAQKLGRRFCGVELNQEYCCWALKRLRQAEADSSIQGYSDGVFWERNSLCEQAPSKVVKVAHMPMLELFDD